MSRQIEHERDATRAAARAFEALGKHRDRERSAARPDESLEVEVVAGSDTPTGERASPINARSPLDAKVGESCP